MVIAGIQVMSRLNYRRHTLKVYGGAASYLQWPAAPMPTTSNCPASNRSDGRHRGQSLDPRTVPELLIPLFGNGLSPPPSVARFDFRRGPISDMLAEWAKRSNPTSRLLRCEPTTSMFEASRNESIGPLRPRPSRP